jgi:ABC-type dipeptide/oligopeptide/nickel transport system permease component
MGLRSYVGTRILLTIPTLLLLLSMVFLVMRVLPGDPVALHFEKKAEPEQMERMRRILGMDKPLWIQYIEYLGGIVDIRYFLEHGYPNLGKSMQTFEEVGGQIFSVFPATLELAIYSMIIASIIGILLGAISSKSYNSVLDHLIRGFGTVTYAIPVFFLGIIFQLIFGVYLRWLPTGLRLNPSVEPPSGLSIYLSPPSQGFLCHFLLSSIAGLIVSAVYVAMLRIKHAKFRLKEILISAAVFLATWIAYAYASWYFVCTGELHISTGLYTVDSLLEGNLFTFFESLKTLLLPSLTLGIILSGMFIRMTRTNMLETLRLDFVTAARARGLKESTVTYGYALRNAFLPVLTMMGLQFAILLGGAILTETTFSWPGLGRYIVQRISFRDYTAIQGAVVMFGLFITLVSLVVDILYAYLDPRIRL